MHFRPTQFADPVRDLITLPAREAGVVATAACDPAYVEAVLWEHDGTYLLVLNNHSGQPLENVRVTVPGLGQVASVRSQQRRPVRMSREEGALVLDLAIRLYDFLILERGGN